MSILLAAALVSHPAHAQSGEPAVKRDAVDIVDAIHCRLDAQSYNGFALSLENPAEKGAAKRKWQKIKGSNPFMVEYRLPKPILVAGTYSSAHIAFTSSAILAVLDMPDPAPLAKSEGIENAAEAATSRTKKFLGERIVSDKKERDDALEVTFRTKVAHVMSTVDTHPGKTLYGCSYSITMDED